MACANCGKEGLNSWTTLEPMDISKLPDDLEFVCGSDKELKSGRVPLSFLLDKINALEKEIKELKNGK